MASVTQRKKKGKVMIKLLFQVLLETWIVFIVLWFLGIEPVTLWSPFIVFGPVILVFGLCYLGWITRKED